MKKLLFFLILITSAYALSAQAATENCQAETVTFRFIPGDDMFYVPWGGNGAELDRLYEVVDRYRSLIDAGTIPVHVDSYTSSMREQRRNANLSLIRANRVKTELILSKRLKEDNFVTKNHTTDYQGHKDIVVVTLKIPLSDSPVEPSLPSVKEEVIIIEDTPREAIPQEKEEMSQPTGVSIREDGNSRELLVRTNLLYDAMLTPTIGVEWRFSRMVGIKIDGSWSHWGSSNGRVQKLWLVSPEIRRYLLADKRFYLGLGANIGQANIYKGLARALSKDTGYQGKIYGGGLTVGYNLRLNSCLDIDFNLGLGYTRFQYDTFTISNGYRVNKGRDLTKNFWGPTQAGIALQWKVLRRQVQK